MTYQKLLTQAAIRFTPVLESIGTTCDIWRCIPGSTISDGGSFRKYSLSVCPSLLKSARYSWAIDLCSFMRLKRVNLFGIRMPPYVVRSKREIDKKL
jgi:hypothetical protein